MVTARVLVVFSGSFTSQIETGSPSHEEYTISNVELRFTHTMPAWLGIESGGGLPGGSAKYQPLFSNLGNY